MEILGLDIGGSGIKGGIVETKNGQLVSERLRLKTPKPSTPELMAEVVATLVETFNWKGPIGCSFPTVVLDGKCMTAGNISPKWVGIQIDELFTKYSNGSRFYVANDADLAGIAEMTLGAGKGATGKVIIVTIGTGLGSGIFYNSQLIPNVELGRMFHLNGKPIEFYAASSVKTKENLKMKDWADRLDFFLNHVERVFAPDNFIIGGGISKEFEKFEKFLTTNVPIEKAVFENNAGIIGASIYAESCIGPMTRD